MKLALLGFGVVGGGVYELLKDRTDLEIKYVLVRRPHEKLGKKAVSSMDVILDDPEVTLVLEAMGGLQPAFQYVSAALSRGKHVVTSNKALIAAYYEELTALSRAHGAALRCAGSVGGGIPWLSALEKVRRLDRITEVSGILNGTTNYMLDLMTKEGCEFSDALHLAQELGYAELDPTADLDGWDIRRKLVISANIAFGVSLREADIPMAGIRNLTSEEIASFRKVGLVCRMLAAATRRRDFVSAYVEPTLVPSGAPEAAVPLNFNRITLRAEKLGVQSFSGEGAGRFPTASNMLQDCLDIAGGCRRFYTDQVLPCSVDNGPVRRSYYVRADDPQPFRALAAGKLGSGLVTKPISVSEMHALSGQCRFFAALPKNFEV